QYLHARRTLTRLLSLGAIPIINENDAIASDESRYGDNEFRVSGRDVERVVALNDLTSPDAMGYITHRLDRLGVNRLLAKAGAADGDVVWIADFSFEYRDA
ncbi:MAG: Obg family GTPase CgtA, partial [Ilumatobacteraceae bacterium]